MGEGTLQIVAPASVHSVYRHPPLSYLHAVFAERKPRAFIMEWILAKHARSV